VRPAVNGAMARPGARGDGQQLYDRAFAWTSSYSIQGKKKGGRSRLSIGSRRLLRPRVPGVDRACTGGGLEHLGMLFAIVPIGLGLDADLCAANAVTALEEFGEVQDAEGLAAGHWNLGLIADLPVADAREVAFAGPIEDRELDGFGVVMDLRPPPVPELACRCLAGHEAGAENYSTRKYQRFR